jgi:hypothetical protein
MSFRMTRRSRRRRRRRKTMTMMTRKRSRRRRRQKRRKNRIYDKCLDIVNGSKTSRKWFALGVASLGWPARVGPVSLLHSLS